MLCSIVFFIGYGCHENSPNQDREIKKEQRAIKLEPLTDFNIKGFRLLVIPPHIDRIPGKCIPPERRFGNHINITLNYDGVPDVENPILDVHVTYWKRNSKPRYCFGVSATKGQNNRYGRNNVIFCVSNCSNSRIQRALEAWEEIKTAALSLQVYSAFILLSPEFCEFLAYRIVNIVVRILTPGLLDLFRQISGLPPLIPPELIEQPPPIECPNDVPEGIPLPHEFNPDLTVVARNFTGLHVIGHEADQYHFVQYYADPNPANLLTAWVQGNWNGFSMGFEIPYGYNKFTPAKQQGSDFLPAGGPLVKVGEGVQIINNGFALTCGNRTSDQNLLTDQDMIHYPIECARDVDPELPLPSSFRPELTVITRRWGVHVLGQDAEQYRLCQFYADPNPANLLTTWVNGAWDGISMFFEEPCGYNRFTPAKQQDRDFLPAGDINTRVSDGVQIINNGFAYTCGNRTSNQNLLSEQDQIPPPPDQNQNNPPQQPNHQGLFLERIGNQIKIENGQQWTYSLWWAIPNPNNVLAIWLPNQQENNYQIINIPAGRNRFVISETDQSPTPDQFYPVASYIAELGQGIRIVGTDFEIDN